jgi:hypothetical protein
MGGRITRRKKEGAMFSGYVVTYWNHEMRKVQTDRYETVAQVLDRGFEELPDAEELADDLYEVFGDAVGLVTDLEGAVLLDRQSRMARRAQQA